MKKSKFFVGLLAFILLFNNLSCANEDRHSIEINQGGSWSDVGNHMSSDEPWDTSCPNVNITEIGSGQIGANGSNSDITSSIEENIDNKTTVYDMVYRNVQYTLEDAGFTTNLGGATEIIDGNTPQNMKRAIDPTKSDTSLGIIYYRDDFNLFDKENFYSAGFYEIVNKDEISSQFKDDSIVYLQALDFETQNDYICAYSYDNIGFDHFVFKNKYITYHCRNDHVIEYQEFPNQEKYYNLSYGSLYDYDKGRLIYDESLFDGYLPHSASSLFDEVDYNKLQEDIKKHVEEQNKNGYNVDSVDVVYISPEAIDEYLTSEEDATFFGYEVKELTKTLGEGNTLTYKDGKLQVAPAPFEPGESYSWKDFWIKIAKGAGVILVGATLTAVTGGASFGCALLTIVRGAATFAITSALTELATNTAKGLGEGKNFLDAINSNWESVADKFSNGFLVGSVMTSIGVATRLVKPVACFEKGTLVATYSLGEQVYKPIEEIKEGDQVISYNQDTMKNEVNRVTDTMVNKNDKRVSIDVNGETIYTTPNHPFFDKKTNGWVSASSLQKGDEVYTLEGKLLDVDDVNITYLTSEVDVYNLTVENNHNYYVGENKILVHNKCTVITNNNLNTSNDSIFKKAKDKILKKIVDKGYELRYGIPKDFMDFIRGHGQFPDNYTDGLGGHIKDALSPKDIFNAYREGLATRLKTEEKLKKKNLNARVVEEKKGIKEVIISFLAKDGKSKLETIKIGDNFSDILMKVIEGDIG